ncbi:phytanoyl-CoA dioxygenase family protein [Candidatus Pelagibacter sp. HIMB1321]|uniref:phytanoyl-CoA dioxygenase family protein n=1 Tax=Candidatus Pelagibacter sp. HIMB1321 TaxID=1388755 RepID=UPI000A07F355|nr:phytanoyl-CoA dioxygenase family protein [Candidatus Pelagibacter sp. HIMB1321]SMF77796.1 Protein involved in biosynthesis of mitomycin antibiotics/polyketide fumonisin [Candidatus Pelagibacter sp. HIMB1321]
MKKEDILKFKPKIISEEKRLEFFEDGGIKVENILSPEWLQKCQKAINNFINESRNLKKSNSIYDIQPDHTKENPKLRRVSSPCDYNDDLWRLLTEGPIGDVAEDILGPVVRFYQSKLNFKNPKGGTEVKWHQDKPYFPHTNDSVITIGVYLENCTDEQGPLEIIKTSHQKDVIDHYDNGKWLGNISEKNLIKINLDDKKILKGNAGSITIHNYRTVHGSKPNNSELPRPLMLYVLSSGDSVPFTPQPLKSKYEQAIVRGKYDNKIRCDSGEFIIPPNWSNGYSSIFAIQQKETPN